MSSQQQQHVINMTGLDSGPVTTTISGGGLASISNSGNQATQAFSASTSSNTSMSNIPPGAYMSPRLHQSAYAPMSPSQNPPSTYTSPILTTLSPNSASAANTSLNRSQSLSSVAHQQMQSSSSPQLQQAPQQGYISSSSSSMYPQQPIEASPYRSRERNQPSYSEGNSSGALLPTINTHLPSSSLMSSPYSPSMRNSMVLDTQSYNTSGPPRSPVTRQQGSPYTAVQNHRPVSMLDQGYGLHAASSSRNSYRPTDNRTSPNHRASPSAPQSNQHLRSSDPNSSLLPTHMKATSPPGDSLPLYSSPTAPVNQMPSSPYNHSSSTGLYTGAPPRTSGVGSYHSANNYDQMNLEAATAGPSNSNSFRERRGTLTNATVSGVEWDRQRLATAAAAELQQQPRVKLQEGFRRVRDVSDLKAVNEPAIAGTGRRADPMGGYVSPLKAMTAYLHHTYHLVNPAFFYELSFNPRRVLTKPSKPMHNEGHDNEDSDYILYVNDWLGAEEGNKYLILDILGQGTFGQVVKCQNMKTREIVAVKVIKNKPAYFNQSMMEVTILEMLNGNWDPHDEHHILRLRDTFIHAKHLCLVFELLSSNLYELIKQNSFRGLSTSLVRVFTTQLLDALTVLQEARLIHCDLKPENILLKTLQTPSIKLVDFGSACHERQTVYTYIQSRFYRSPEVLLGLPYNASIDMWSLGCIAVELFLGLPLFPGTSEYNQVCRIVEMLGLPPTFMLESGKQTGEFFNVFTDEYNRRTYKLKSLEQYSKEHNVQEAPSKRYFQATTLPDIVKTYPLARKSGKPADVQKEMANRNSFIDFVTGLLHMDPTKRWTPQQAKLHPFITGEKLTQPFRPPASPAAPLTRSKSTTTANNTSADATRHPYGGLLETPSRSSGRVYHDAAAYNQHLAQQQAYNSAHQARQNQAPVINNPYAQEDSSNRQVAEASASAQARAAAAAKTQAQIQQVQAHAYAQAQAQAQAHAQVQAAMSPPYGQASGSASTVNSSYSQTRSRSNTMTRMDLVPGQMAKMGIEAGHSMTPILNREDSMREWERRQQQQQQSNGASGSNRQQKRNDYQHLDLLQQQADASQSTYSTSTGQNWSQQQLSSAQGYNPMNRLSTSTTSPSVGNMTHSPSFSVIVDAQQQQQQLRHASPASLAALQHSLASPTRATQASAPSTTYTSPNNTSNRYQPGNSNPSLAAFDPYTPDISQLMPALQPTQYQGSGSQIGLPGTNIANVPRRQSMMPLSTSNFSSSLYGGGPTSPTSPMHRSLEEGYSQASQSGQNGPYHTQMPTAPPQGGRGRYG